MPFDKNSDAVKERAKKVKLFAHDVHGILTPNNAFVDGQGNRRYAFWHMDGFGDLSLMANDIKPVFLDTTSIDGEGLYRAQELKLDKMYYAVTNKMEKLEELKKEFNLTDEQIGYIGCELSDIPVMKKVGFAVATADARDEVKAVAHYVTNAPGGRGPIREVCEVILRAMGKWEEWVEKVTKMGYK